MKTTVLTILSALVLLTGASNSTYASAPAKAANYTILSGISTINKIEVYGNVELYISDGPADQVKVYNKYYAENALVQSRNGVLRISSYTNEKLVVWVTAADLRSIAAFDKAEIRSFGELSKIDLTIDLHNNASAKLNFDAFNADVTLHDQATADLSGTASNFNLTHSFGSSVNNGNLLAAHSSEKRINMPAGKNGEDIAGL